MPRLMTCPSCVDTYLKGVKEIDACIYFCAAHGGVAPQYHSNPFKFCPWCGNKLIDLIMDEQGTKTVDELISEQENVNSQFREIMTGTSNGR